MVGFMSRSKRAFCKMVMIYLLQEKLTLGENLDVQYVKKSGKKMRMLPMKTIEIELKKLQRSKL
jgi:hypothetical protein